MGKFPYVYNELKALLEKAGTKIDDVYAITFRSNLRQLDEGTLIVSRYLRGSDGDYSLCNGDVLTETTEMQVCGVKREGG